MLIQLKEFQVLFLYWKFLASKNISNQKPLPQFAGHHLFLSLCVRFRHSHAVGDKSLQLYLTLCDPMPGSSVHGILQARLLEWVAMPSSRGSSWPRDGTSVLCLLCWQPSSLLLAPPGKPYLTYQQTLILYADKWEKRAQGPLSGPGFVTSHLCSLGLFFRLSVPLIDSIRCRLSSPTR